MRAVGARAASPGVHLPRAVGSHDGSVPMQDLFISWIQLRKATLHRGGCSTSHVERHCALPALLYQAITTETSKYKAIAGGLNHHFGCTPVTQTTNREDGWQTSNALFTQLVAIRAVFRNLRSHLACAQSSPARLPSGLVMPTSIAVNLVGIARKMETSSTKPNVGANGTKPRVSMLAPGSLHAKLACKSSRARL